MKKQFKKSLKRVALCLGVVLTCSQPASAGLYCFEGAKVVAKQELDSMRGGFITTSGLEISISIIKAVVIDGVLQTVSQLNVPDLTQLSSSSHHAYPVVTTSNPTVAQTTDITTANPVVDQPANATTANPVVAQPLNATTANSTAAPVNSALPAAVVENSEIPTIIINSTQTESGTIVRNFGGSIAVQNSTNGVTIQNNTTINATTNSATMMHRINLSSRITQQLIDSAYH